MTFSKTKASVGVTMQASIHPIQSEHAKVGSWEGGKGRHTRVGVKYLWRGEGVESVVMMYGA